MKGMGIILALSVLCLVAASAESSENGTQVPSTEFDCRRRRNGIYTNPSSCSTFYKCSGRNSYLYTCPQPLYFNSDLYVCDWPENVKCESDSGVTSEGTTATTAEPFNCSNLPSGLYPNPTDCRTFYKCSNGYTYPYDCPANLVFNPNLLVCDWPENVPSCSGDQETTEAEIPETTEAEVPVTTENPASLPTQSTEDPTIFNCSGRPNGLYPNPSDCLTFYKCSNGYTYLYDCPANLVFNPELLVCDWVQNVPSCSGDHETTEAEVPETTEAEVPETTEAEVPETTEAEVPETTEAETPETTEAEVPETTEAEVPETTEAEVPETTEAEVPETTEAEIPETTEAEIPETTEAEAPETTEAEIPETTEAEIPETTEAEIPETTEAEIPETTEAEVPETTEAEIPETTEAENPETTEAEIPETTEAEIPETTEAEVPETTEAEIPETTEAEIPETTEAENPETTEAEVPETTEAEIPETTEAEIPETTEAENPETTEAEVPETTENFPSSPTQSTEDPTVFNCSGRPNGLYPNPSDCLTFYKCSNGHAYLYNCPENLVFNPELLICDWPQNVPSCSGDYETTEAEIPETTEAEIPETTEAEIPETTEAEAPETTEAEIPETTEAEVPETTEAEVPETTEAEIPETTEAEIPGTTEAEAPETTEAEIPETTEAEVPETTEAENPETTEAENPETTEAEIPETTEAEIPETTEAEIPETTEAEIPETTEAEIPETTENATSLPTQSTEDPTIFNCSGRPNGLYPNPSDCLTFYKCSNGYTYLYDCPANLVFNPELLVCDWPQNVPSCSGDHETTEAEVPESTEAEVPETTEAEIPETTENPASLPTQSTEDPTIFNCSGRPNGVYPNPSDCLTFYKCSNGYTYLYDCPANLVFNPELLICDYVNNVPSCQGDNHSPGQSTPPPAEDTEYPPSTPKPTGEPISTTSAGQFTCPSDGPQANPNSCSTFYICANSVPILFNCPDDLVFNPDILVCDWEYNVPSCQRGTTIPPTSEPEGPTPPPTGAEFSCEGKVNGLYPNPQDCETFFKCSNTFQYKYDCPSRLHFNPNLLVCDSPANAGCISI